MTPKTSVTKLLTILGYKDHKIKISKSDEHQQIDITIEDEQAGALIGHQGETIASLQIIVNLILNQGSESWTRYMLDIDGYKRDREESLKALATKAADNSKSTGKEVILSYIPSNERRIVHTHLQEDKEVETYSEGYGRNRRLVIKPTQNQKLT